VENSPSAPFLFFGGRRTSFILTWKRCWAKGALNGGDIQPFPMPAPDKVAGKMPPPPSKIFLPKVGT